MIVWLTPDDVPDSFNWDWAQKIRSRDDLPNCHEFSVMAQSMTQGLMQVSFPFPARASGALGGSVLYVEYLEVAPWNQPVAGSPQFKGVGAALMTAAIKLSRDKGFAGCIGLHSLPRAEGFYARLGPENLDVDQACDGLSYFEFTADAAKPFLELE